jgi:hypothetical protein
MARRCKCGCGTSMPPASKCTTFLSKQRLSSSECAAKVAIESMKKKRVQESVQKEKAVRKHKKDFYANDTSKQLALTQKSFNRMIKLEEFIRLDEPQCISCGKAATISNLGMFCAGHLKTVGAHNELRFNTLNVRIQCNFYCNSGLSGNINGNKNTHGYLQGLIMRIGQDGYDSTMLKLERKNLDFTRSAADLQIVRRWCNARIRVLEKQLESCNA